jgi:hypothetical protein
MVCPRNAISALCSTASSASSVEASRSALEHGQHAVELLGHGEVDVNDTPVRDRGLQQVYERRFLDGRRRKHGHGPCGSANARRSRTPAGRRR